MNKKEKIAFAFVAALAMTSGILIGQNINSGSNSHTMSPTTNQSNSAAKFKSENCRNLGGIPLGLSGQKKSDYDRKTLFGILMINSVTNSATKWTSKLDVETKNIFQRLFESAQTMAWQSWSHGWVSDEDWDSLKNSLKEAFKYCSLDESEVEIQMSF